jgi:hypothetical protein
LELARQNLNQKGSNTQMLFNCAILESQLGLESARSSFESFCQKFPKRAYLGHYYLAEIAYNKNDKLQAAKHLASAVGSSWPLRFKYMTSDQSVMETERGINLARNAKDASPETLLERGIMAARAGRPHLADELISKAYPSLPSGSKARVQAGMLLYVMHLQGKVRKSNSFLRGFESEADKSAWAAPLMKYLRGRLSEPELIASAKGNSIKLTSYHYYLLAMDRSKSDLVSAKRHTAWLKLHGDRGMDEYELAEPLFLPKP